MIRRLLKKVFRPNPPEADKSSIFAKGTSKDATLELLAIEHRLACPAVTCGEGGTLDQNPNFETPSGPMIIPIIVLLLFICISIGWAHTATADTELTVGAFSASEGGPGLPTGWEPVNFKRIQNKTEYKLVLDENTWVLNAQSAASASGLIYRIEIDPRELPVIRWRWKVSAVLAKGNVTQKKGDDYPARIYITFAYDPTKLTFLDRAKYKAARLIYGEYPPTGTITYIWANKAPIGTMVTSPYTERDKMIVLQSGAVRRMQWVQEKRNVYEDYRIAFGHEPPNISAVALMTDTDDTGESVSAYYGDIIFSAE